MQIDIKSAYGEQPPSERTGNPLGLLIAVIREKPSAGADAHKKAFKRLLLSEGCEDDLEKVIDEWQSIKYSTALSAAVPPSAADIKRATEEKRNARQAAAAERRSKAAKIAEAVKQIVMLDLTMPNGKKLRDCTGAECVTFGDRFRKIGETVGARRIVGKALTEEQVRELML